MKKNLKLLITLIFALILILPLGVSAKDYKTLNFKEALADEEIDEQFKNYSENNNQVTIYLFRGKGCSYCRAFLTFMNSITDEYGKYFKIVSYEVWNDLDNYQLMTAVSTYLDQYASGVPYIIIGDKVFRGYSNQYDEEIKEAIINLYNTNKDARYDVFKSMDNDNWDYSITYSQSSDNDTTAYDGNSDDVLISSEETTDSNSKIIIWNFLFVLTSTVFIIFFINFKFKKLEEKLETSKKKNK